MSQVSGGNVSSCALKTDGTVYCWGWNSDPAKSATTLQLQEITPVQVLGVGASGYLTGVSQVSGGYVVNCAFKTDGTVYCWGENSYGNIGDNTTTVRYTPVQVLGVGASGYLDLIPSYYSSGNFESAIIDLGGVASFNTLVFNATTTSAQTSCTASTGAGCAVKIQVAAALSSNPAPSWNYVGPDGTASTYFTISGGETIPSSLNGNRYVRYKVYLATTDVGYTPSLNNITINYSQYLTALADLTSSKYDSNSAANLISKISWTGSATSTTETIKFQVRSSADGATWSNWCGYSDSGSTCSGSNYFENSNNGATLASGHPLKSDGNDRWLQYKVTLNSGGGITPILNSVIIQYVVNSPPDFDATYGTSGVNVSQIATSTDANWGKVSVEHKSRDIDTTTGVTPNLVSATFEYRLSPSSSWTAMSSAYLNPTSASRVIAEAYTTTSTFWTALSQIPEIYSTTTQVRVILNDSDGSE